MVAALVLADPDRLLDLGHHHLSPLSIRRNVPKDPQIPAHHYRQSSDVDSRPRAPPIAFISVRYGPLVAGTNMRTNGTQRRSPMDVNARQLFSLTATHLEPRAQGGIGQD